MQRCFKKSSSTSINKILERSKKKTVQLKKKVNNQIILTSSTIRQTKHRTKTNSKLKYFKHYLFYNKPIDRLNIKILIPDFFASGNKLFQC